MFVGSVKGPSDKPPIRWQNPAPTVRYEVLSHNSSGAVATDRDNQLETDASSLHLSSGQS
jgi:hypothetical protein